MNLKDHGWQRYMFRVERHLKELYKLDYEMKLTVYANGFVHRAWMVRK